MPTYRIHFSQTDDEPYAPLEMLATVECDDPVQAVEILLGRGQVPQDQIYRWARVVLTTHPNGRPRHVVRVPISPQAIEQLDFRSLTSEGDV
jgi:hypothetical protein